jgi:hypothetical protein
MTTKPALCIHNALYNTAQNIVHVLYHGDSTEAKRG